ncbi:putative ABC transport system permease protein [Catalinimonas alkaloidigena]|uniref:Putative ABC transport system permease protein n=1 Tax=Catalinimonas alkaloidigena TaxID=1075417 RepID=A0A1G8X603_9BACT|nr:ABC transporter permease [Catalinimonas alkaloidigena]SDJ85854.1 putative ABC transport system permease protein [Catalinimonas alkaloidigena]
MLRHYLVAAFRNIRKQKLYAGLNILGLSVGMACALLLGSYVQRELSFDQFHSRADRIFLSYLQNQTDSKVWRGTYTEGKLLLPLAHEIASVERVTQVFPLGRDELAAGDRSVNTPQNILAVDTNFFHVFDFSLTTALPQPLQAPNQILLTDSMARALFGDGDALGQTVVLRNHDYQVAGLVREAPENSHLHFAALISHASLESVGNAFSYYGYGCHYLLARAGTDPDRFAQEISEKITTTMNAGHAESQYSVALLPLRSLHFYQDFDWNPLVRTENRQKVYIFLAVGLLVLLLGCLNFVIIFTARSSLRNLEVGVRKVMGASRAQIVSLYFVEVLLMALAALLLSVLLTDGGVRLFRDLADTPLTIRYFSWNYARLALGVLACIGLLAGLYPALQFSRFQPIQLLEKRFSRGKTGVRDLLIIGQFVISLVMMAATVLMYQQLDFLKRANLGFANAQLVVVTPQRSNRHSTPVNEREKLMTLKDRWTRHPHVVALSRCATYPGAIAKNRYDDYQTVPASDRPSYAIRPIYADLDYLRVLQPEWVQYDSLRAGTSHIVLNQKAVEALSLDDPLTASILNLSDSTTTPVAAIINDFHYTSLKQEVEPLALTLLADADTSWKSTWLQRLIVRLDTRELQTTLASLQDDFALLFPGYTMDVKFVDEQFATLYAAEDRLLHFFLIFSGLAIFVSCLGLFGLTTFLAAQRFREINLRKVLGASGRDIAWLLVHDLSRLFLLANVVAIPLAWFLMQRWLEDFALRIGIGPDAFALAAGMALVLSLGTVSYQLWRATQANPADALRAE